ncbi:MAG TPA: DNA starvation/stationary phase protection protein Dps [Chthoniobacteraceae bacterium]|jgi:starvation-inducible DNA-binding protein|nr:DNA starvation/stationary phase protection protein Dps [Chthoniobacteraceae bacterium]
MKTPHKTKNSLSPAARAKAAALLNQTLANCSDLYSQTKQAHWNLRGLHFYQYHLLFDRLAGMVEEHLDTVAERVSSLGGVARGTVRDAAKNSELKEFPTEPAGDVIYLEALIDRYAVAANSTRKAIDESDDAGDADTADLLTAVSRDLDEALWLLEAGREK